MSVKREMKSILAPYILLFLEEKRSLGFKYEANEYTLFRFDMYCINSNLNTVEIDQNFLSGWMAKWDSEGEHQHSHRISAVRQLLTFMSALGIKVYIPNDFSHVPITVPHILTSDEITSFFEQVDSYTPKKNNPKHRRMANEYKVIFRLIYTCGLRLSEACNLSLEDVDLDNSALLIRDSKTHSQRLVYLSDDMSSLCKKYSAYLHNAIGSKPLWFFPAYKVNNRMLKTTIDMKFKEMWNRTTFARMTNNPPTCHDLRYTFVSRKINEWNREGIDFDIMGPYLVKYLGHKSFYSTHYYYHLSSETFSVIEEKDSSARFVIPTVGENWS